MGDFQIDKVVKMRILIIDSDVRLTDAINREIEEAQYELRYEADSETGLQVALKKRFDLIILDWSLPKKPGLSILTNLRKRKNRTPVLMLVAENSVRDVVLSLDSGANTCMPRPFIIPVLIARMKAVIRRYKWDRSTEIYRYHNKIYKFVAGSAAIGSQHSDTTALG